eukprot:TRINITY_DN67265_c3_g1_i1.p1 TRINITY_DN67265_c3_g1~~TRINITY_DN67265_c3_g1_i1.p1  ORF type:complete len:334 (+),score=34.67 TRINITY_DN67265_c3_g1_i1:44-1045(+)
MTKPDPLIPITIDVAGLTESITWNLNEKSMTPGDFAKIICTELNLPAEHTVHVEQQITSQLQQAKQVCGTTPKREYLITIKLNVRVEDKMLVDQFEWSVGGNTAVGGGKMNPDEFAQQLVSDLKLGPEWLAPIATSIRHQIYDYIQDTHVKVKEIEDGHVPAEPEWTLPDNCPSMNLEREIPPPGCPDVWRPRIVELTKAEIQQMEIREERDMRKHRRTLKPTTENPSLKARRSAVKLTPAQPQFSPNVNPGGYIHHQATTNDGVVFSDNRRLKNGRFASVMAQYHKTTPNGKHAYCTNCGLDARNTPIMRRGPAGPSSLCNRCGIAYTKGKL